MNGDLQRISITIRNPNPLFRKWLSEWANHADNTERANQATALRRALHSLEKYPLPLKSGAECIILDGFGKAMCETLDKKLAKHRKHVAEDKLLRETQNIPSKEVPLPPVPQKANKSPVKARLPRTEVSQKAADSLSSRSQQPSTSAAGSKRIRKVKSAQNLPSTSSSTSVELPAAVSQPRLFEEQPGGSGGVTGAAPQADKGIAEEVIMIPGTFEIILLVDSSETQGKNKRYVDATILELQKNAVPFEVRRLNVGDFLWIARDPANKHELVLPYIVERKRLDDMAGSIKSGRFHEQKFRLRNSGIPNITYLIEYIDLKHYGLPIQTLYKAAVNAELHSDCQIKFTDGAKETILYLSVQTTLLAEAFSSKILCGCPKESLPPSGTTNNDWFLNGDTVSLMHFGEFHSSASKWGAVQVRDFFVRQLVQLFQMSVEKALGITNVYATPRALLAAYADPGLPDEASRQALLSKIAYGPAGRRTIGLSLSKIIYDLYHTKAPS